MQDDPHVIVERYLTHFPAEAARQVPLRAFLHSAGSEWWKRSHREGHATASAVVIDPAADAMLVIHHLVLDCWLQPGGHIEADDETLVAAAMREVVEETGVQPANLKLIPLDANAQVPIDIDTHPIAARPAKGEPAHLHYDFRYLFAYTGDGGITLNAEEATGCEWRKLSSLEEDETFALLIRKARSLRR